MKAIKKLSAVLVGLVVAAGLVACGAPAEEDYDPFELNGPGFETEFNFDDIPELDEDDVDADDVDEDDVEEDEEA